MTTQTRPRSSAKSGKQTEASGAVRMTRSLSGVPFDCRSLYEVRRGKRRLMGDFPAIAVRLAAHGAPPADVLYPLQSVEREVLKQYARTINATLSTLQRDETDAQNRLDQAQLAVAAMPNDKSAIEAALEAAQTQVIATELLSAKLAEMESSL